MFLFPLALAGGWAAGCARGGRTMNISRLRIRFLFLFALAVGLLVAERTSDSQAGRWAAMGGAVVLSMWLCLNALHAQKLMRLAFAVLALGWTLNVMVITANDGMPVSSWAMHQARTPAAAVHAGPEGAFLQRHEFEQPGAILRPLADAIPLRPFAMVVSLGDLFIYAGFALVIARAMRLPPSRLGALGTLHYEPSMHAGTHV